jgi:hypothetical protein
MTLTTRGTFLNREDHRDDFANEAVQRHGTLILHLPGGQIRLQIEYVDDEVVVSDEVSGLFGEGRQVGQAVADLVTHMDLALKDLEAFEGPISPESADELQRLRFYLRG